MIIDGFTHQLPDTDPEETQGVARVTRHGDLGRGKRSRPVPHGEADRACRAQNVGVPASVSTPYINTIPPEAEAWFPGDEYLEQRIRRFIRWNAAIMVIKANKAADGIGGHLSTFASSAMLYEVGFNHFFRGKDDGTPGDHVYIQGHAAPGIYATLVRRAPARRGRPRPLPARDRRRSLQLPHPRLMPDFWEYPTVSMGLGPDQLDLPGTVPEVPPQPADRRYVGLPGLVLLGDGETDEPETLGSISLASREKLDNLTWVINCNLQRLDGPVRGNGKIIQELEAVFRGAGLERHQGHLGIELGSAARSRSSRASSSTR